MNASDHARFRESLMAMAEYYGKPVSQAIASLWWQGLREFSVEAVEAALNAHLQNPDAGQFMPRIADVVKHIKGRTEDQAVVAWSKVNRAARSVGSYDSVVFDDAIIHAVVRDMGGWIYLCGKNEDEWPFVAREFETRYRGYVMKGGASHYPRQLPGRLESDALQHGHKPPPPVLLGDKTKALEVKKNGEADQPALVVTRIGNIAEGITQQIAEQVGEVKVLKG